MLNVRLNISGIHCVECLRFSVLANLAVTIIRVNDFGGGG
jgi:hypothetical protein